MLLQTEPPQNGQFMVAAYVLVAVVLLVYSVTLVLRARRIEREVPE
jgi:hypothetical protein